MLEWLRSDHVVGADGRVVSWTNPAHPGHSYPEAAGLLLGLLAHEGLTPDPVRERIVRGIISDTSAAGGCGKQGREYVFDAAMVLNGLLEHERSGGSLPDPLLPCRLFGFIADNLLKRQAASGLAGGDRKRWSLSYGAHLLKVVRALSLYHRMKSEQRCKSLIGQIAEDLVPLYSAGRFHIHADSTETYVHSHCYAVSGLLCLERDGLSSVTPIIGGCAGWLAQIQESQGGIREWHDGDRSYGEVHADCTAQAVRIWAHVDRAAFADEIIRALEFLAGQQSSAGGLYYAPGCADENTWATIFAVQAVRWASEGACEQQLI